MKNRKYFFPPRWLIIGFSSISHPLGKRKIVCRDSHCDLSYKKIHEEFTGEAKDTSDPREEKMDRQPPWQCSAENSE